jgi:hypothetical protein
MADKPQRGSEIRDWVQTLIIIAGLGLGLWEFVFKEIWAPAAAPINLTTEVTVKEAGFRGASGPESKGQFEAVELMVAARNPSSREIYLLANCWHARGLAILTRTENEGWADAITKQMEKGEGINNGAYYVVNKSSAVAAGTVFTDESLHPNESISASFVFYVPRDVYDLLHVRVELPSTGVRDSAESEWTVTPDHGCKLKVYRKRNGVRGEEIKSSDSVPEIQLQTETSTRQLSLWQSQPEPPAATKGTGTSQPSTR